MEGDGFGDGIGLGRAMDLRREIGWWREMGRDGDDALWEGHTLSMHRHTHTQTDRQIHKSENSISASFTRPFTWQIIGLVVVTIHMTRS